MALPVEIVSEGVDWPAWVQAVGSIIAIVAAIAVAKWDEVRRQAERRAKRREFRASVAALARRMADLIGQEACDIVASPSSYDVEAFDNAQYEILDAVLERFDPSLMDSVNGALAIESIRRAGRAAPDWINAMLQENNGERPGDAETVSSGVSQWAKEANDAAKTLELLAKA